MLFKISGMFIASILSIVSLNAWADSGIPPSLVKPILESHGADLKDFGEASRDCRLHFETFANNGGTVVIVKWDACSIYCGTAGCRVLIYGTQFDGRWMELSDSVVRDIKIKSSNNAFHIEVELGGVSCGLPNAKPCFKRGIIKNGKLVVN